MKWARAARIAVILALFIGGGWSAWTIRLETELLPLMPQTLPSVRGLQGFQQRFGNDREILLVADPSMPAEERGEVFDRLRPKIAAVPGVAAVVAPGEDVARDLPALAAWALWNLPPERFATVVKALTPEQARARLEQLPEALAGALDPAELMKLQLDPLRLLEALGISGDGGGIFGATTEGETPAFLIIRAARPLVNFDECIAMTSALQDVLGGETRLLLTGRPVFTAEISRQMRGDMGMMMGVAVTLICCVFWLFYRTLRPLGWILLLQFLALLGALIVARLAFGTLNVISMGFASILLGVSMDYCILVYHHFASAHRNDSAIWARLIRGIWFSAATTAASFLVLAFSSFPGLRQLAALVSSGLLGSALFATWLLPRILARRPPAAPPILDRVSHAAADFIGRRRAVVLIATVILAGIAVILVARDPDRFYTGDLSQFRPTASGAWRGQEWLLGVDQTEGDAIYLLRARNWEEVKAGAEQLAGKVSQGQMSPWTALLPAPEHQAANRALWPEERVAGLRAAFEAEEIGPEWSSATLALVSALDRAATGDPEAFQAVAPRLATLASEDADGVTAVVRLPGAADHPVPPGGFTSGPVEVQPVSWVSLKDELRAAARHDLQRLGGWMLVAIVILCALAQRKVRLVLLNLAALLLALLGLAALLAFTGTRMSPISLLSVPLLLGLAIDYSLHILMAMEHSQGNLRHTYSHLAAPVVLTGLSSCIGFGAPILTQQPALRNFGLVMDFGILSAVAVGLLVLPALYSAVAPRSYTRDLFYRFFYRPEGFGWAVFWAKKGRWVIRLIARIFAFGYCLTHPAALAVVRRNLALLDPRCATWLNVFRLYQHQGLNFAEYGFLASKPPEQALELLGRRDGFEHLTTAQAGGKGCLLVTAHFGFFELGGLLMRQLGHPVVALTLPEPTTQLSQWRSEFRGRWGVRTVEVGRDSLSVVEVVRQLRAGSFVALLGDRPYDDNQAIVSFPHGRTAFATGPVLLALMAECPIVPVACVRDHDGLYRAIALPAIYPRKLPDGRDATLRHFTQQIADALIPLLREYPDQWFQFVNVVDSSPPSDPSSSPELR